MILTVTMNPSIDTSYQLDHLKTDDVNRVVASKTAGGKGLNVTRILSQLNDDVVATGLVGGCLGAFIEKNLDEAGIKHSFTHIAGESRVCIAALHDGGLQTEFLEAGPCVSEQEIAEFSKHMEELLAKAGVLTISGSLPQGVDASYYTVLLELANNAGVPVLLDSSGKALLAALKADHKPYLIKPNLTEVSELFDHEFSADKLDELREALSASELMSGIEWIVITMGGDGSVALHNGELYRVSFPAVSVVNPVGSGDSTVAGFAHAVQHKLSPEKLLTYGTCCGTLNAMHPKTGCMDMSLFDEIFSSITVAKL